MADFRAGPMSYGALTPPVTPRRYARAQMTKPRHRARRGRGTTLARALKLLRLLQTRRSGITVAETAGELETTTRTIYRDLAALQEAGFPLTAVKDGDRVWWRLLRDRRAR